MYFFSTKTRPWRRRNYLINKAFQLRFITRFLFVVLAGSAVSGFVMYTVLNRKVEDFFYSTHIKLSSVGQVLLPDIIKVNLFVVAVVLLAVALITILITHKVSGPLYRLGASVEKIGDGDFSNRFSLRKGDELDDLARSFEDMSDGLKRRFIKMKTHAMETDQAAEALLLQHASSCFKKFSGDETAGRERLSELSDRAKALGEAITSFKIEKSPPDNPRA